MSSPRLVWFTVIMGALTLSSACEGSLDTREHDPERPGDVQPGPLPDQGSVTPSPGVDGGMPIIPGMDGGMVVDESDMGEPEPCSTPEAVFEREVWPKVAKPVCLGCHVDGGSASQLGATFLLEDEGSLSRGELSLDEFYAHNLQQFKDQAALVDGMPRYLLKAIGGQGHGGGAVVVEGREEHEALLTLQESMARSAQEVCEPAAPIEPLAHIQLLDGPGTLRKATMMLAGRLPTEEELAQLDGIQGEAAQMERVAELVREQVMTGYNFRAWLKYAWNEVFNFRGTWQLDVTFPFQIVSPNDYRARRWGFINSAGAPDCEVAAWEGDDTPLWQRFGYPSLAACKDNVFRRSYLSDRVAWSLIEEPLEMIAWVIMTDRAFTEVLTTDVVMMNYYSSIVYYGSALPGDNAFVAQHGTGLTRETLEYPGGAPIPSIELPSLHAFRPMRSTRRSRQRRDANDQLRYYYVDGEQDIPRAGLLTSQIFLNRYPSTDTNLNRHRAWSYFINFLGVDILALADRRGDPAAAELGSDQPTIDDANCNVCHKVMDPIAGLFQDFGDDGRWQPDAAWPTRGQPNIIPPGSSIVGTSPQVDFTDEMAASTSPLKWLAEQTITDKRFATRMVRHAFLQLTGHEPLELPLDTDKPGWKGRRVAFELQSRFLAELSEGFIANNFDMKWVLVQIITSPWYRASGMKPDVTDADTLASVEGFGDGDQLLTPEYLHRKIEAILERPWQHTQYTMTGNRKHIIDGNAVANDYLFRYNSDNDFRYIDEIYRDMYGGIDFFNNTERLELPSSVMASVGRRVSNELGCGSVAADFALAPQNRVLFGEVEVQDTMASNPEGIRQTMDGLMKRMWGSSSSAELDAAVELFEQVQTRGKQAVLAEETSSSLLAHCQANAKLPGQPGAFMPLTEDPDYTLRAWAAVVSYLALDARFLYAW